MSNTIEVKEWLKANKLEDIYDVFTKRDITIEEICEFENDDILQFAQELNLDSLARNRFIKAIRKIKQNQNITSNVIQPRKVIVSSIEQESLNKLYEKFDECSQLQNSIRIGYDTLDTVESECINNINIIFDDIIKQLMTKKTILLENINSLYNRKQEILTKQLNTLQNKYIPMLQDGKTQYEQYTQKNKKSLDIIHLVQRILSFNTPTIIIATQPKMLFHTDKAVENNNAFLNILTINDCDKPFIPSMNISKVESYVICISYDIKKAYYKSIGKPILKICIEHAVVKNDNEIWADYKEEKSDDSESESDSDTESSHSDSDTQSETESDNSVDEGDNFGTNLFSKFKKSMHMKGKKKKKKRKGKKKKKKKRFKLMAWKSQKINISEIYNYDTLKWYSEEIIISNKNKKHDKKYKITENVRYNRTYVIRIKLLNESGWSEYDCNLFVIKTPKFGLKSKILTSGKDVMKFKKMIDEQTKGKYGRWKLIFRKSEDGGGEGIFRNKVHEKKNIICLMQSTSGIFGGYTYSGWHGSSGGKYEHDDRAFLFLFKSTNGYKQKVFKVTNPSQALYNQNSYYCFFNGNDCSLYINKNGTTGYASANNGNTFEKYPNSYYLTGGSTFTVTELEVFQLKV